MKNFPFILFCLSFLAFCAVVGFCVLLLLFPFGLFHPVIACDTKILELGTINNDTDIDCRFVIKNIGNRKLLLREAVPVCGSGNELKVIDFSLEPISPGEQRELVLCFHPYALRNKTLKKVVVSSNDPRTPLFALSVSAMVNYVPPPPSSVPVLAPLIN
jgi:hypothetical protein